MPNSSESKEFKMPQTRAKTHASKLFHSQLVRDILIESLTETQIRKDFKRAQLTEGIRSYNTFKKEWIQKKQAEEKREVERLAKEKLKAKNTEQG